MKLELKHLAPYQLYGIELLLNMDDGFDYLEDFTIVRYNDVDYHIVKINQVLDDYISFIDIKTEIDREESIECAKPILIPMNELFDNKDNLFELCKVLFPKKEEPFEDMRKRKDGSIQCVDYTNNGGVSDIAYIEWDSESFLVHRKGNIVGVPYKVYEWLFKHHFDVFGLIDKGLAIDKTELK